MKFFYSVLAVLAVANAQIIKVDSKGPEFFGKSEINVKDGFFKPYESYRDDAGHDITYLTDGKLETDDGLLVISDNTTPLYDEDGNLNHPQLTDGKKIIPDPDGTLYLQLLEKIDAEYIHFKWEDVLLE